MEKRRTLSLNFDRRSSQEILERLPVFLAARLEDGNAARVQILQALKAAPNTRLSFGEVLLRLSLALHRKFIRDLGKSELLLGRREVGAEIEALGCHVKRLPEKIDPAALYEAIRPRTALVSIDWADPVTGLLQPILECAEVCRKKGVLLHVDATHALGREYFHLKDLSDVFVTIKGILPHTDMLLFSEEAPFEAAFLSPPPPFWVLEAYSHSVMARLQEFDVITTQVASLRYQFEEGVKALGGEILHEKSARLPHVTALSFPYVHPEMLHYELSKRGIQIQAPATFVFSPEHSEEDLSSVLTELQDALHEVRPFTAAFSEEKV